MNKKNLLLALATAMMMGGCGKSQPKKDSNSFSKTSKTDTLFVVRALDMYDNARYVGTPRKYLLCTNKTGDVSVVKVFVEAQEGFKEEKKESPFCESGDTIVVQNGKVVKNLTMDRMIKNYVNGR